MICTTASGCRKVNGKNECVLLPGPKTPPVFRRSGEQVSPPTFQPKGLTLEGMDMRITNDVTSRSRGGGGGKVASRGRAGGGFAKPDGAQGARARIYDLQLLDVGRQHRKVSDTDETGAL